MYNVKIVINTKSLESFLDEKHNIVSNRLVKDENRELLFDLSLLEDMIKVIVSNATPLLSTEIKKDEDVLIYLTKYYNKVFRKYNANENYILFILNIVGISLSNFSRNSYEFLEYIYNTVEDFKLFQNEANRYIQTKDLRGLLFWLCRELHIDYDNIKDIFTYIYSPPQRTTSWLKNNRKENEPIEFWFDKTSLGESLFVILFTAKCRYSNCLGCNLPAKSAREDDSKDIFKNQKKIYDQINHLYTNISNRERYSIKELTLSNNGNLYDTETMPFLSLLYIVDRSIQELPNVKKIVLESRIEVIDIEKLKILKETIDKHQKKIILETAVGLEIMNDELRNGYYKKGLLREDIQNFLNKNEEIVKIKNEEAKNKEVKNKKCKQFLNGELKYKTTRSQIDISKTGKLSVKFYMMYMCIPYKFDLNDKNGKNCKSVSKSLEEFVSEDTKENQIAQEFAIQDIKNAIDYFKKLKKDYSNVDINLHINPTYLTEQLKPYKDKNQYNTPTLEDIKELLDELLKKLSDGSIDTIGCFISTNDEGLSEEEKDEDFYKKKILNEAIHQFNQKDYVKSVEILKKLN